MNAAVASETAETLWTFHILLIMLWRCRNHPKWHTKIRFSLRRYLFLRLRVSFCAVFNMILFLCLLVGVGCFFISRREMFPKLFLYIYFLWTLNFLFHLKVKEVTTEALRSAESTRTNLRRWEESSDLNVYGLQTGRVSFQSNLESCFYFSYCDSLKNCASQFSENCVQTVNDNNSEAQSKFQQVRNIYAVNKDNTLQILALEKGCWVDCKKFRILVSHWSTRE